MPSAITITWIAMDMLGLLSLLHLLITFVLVKTLPQRKNPFLINLIFTTFIATLPPCLLFFTGHQDGVPPTWLCLTQSVLMDGIAPMFGLALVVLVIHTWADLSAIIAGKTPITTRHPLVKHVLLLAPYIVMSAWCTSSTVAALQPSAKLQLAQFVYCANNSGVGIPVRKAVGSFMIACGIIEIFFEVWITWTIFTPFKFLRLKRGDVSLSTSYHANVQMYMRLLTFVALQLTPIILASLNAVGWNSFGLKQATQILESMNGIATFLVFGTQKDLLRTWTFWKRLGHQNMEKNASEADPGEMV